MNTNPPYGLDRKKRRTCRFFWSALLAMCALPTAAQTFGPVLSEYRLRADGSFEVVNDGFAPMNVVLELNSFTVSASGEITYRPLDPGITVRFSENSFRVPPKQRHAVFYTAKAAALPAYFVVYAAMSSIPKRTTSGMNVVIKLPHTVYILPKKDAARADVRVVQALFDPNTSKLRIEIASQSPAFARVLDTTITSGKTKVEQGGFPLYPHYTRRLEVDWKEPSPPEKVTFAFEHFKVEASVSPE